MTTWAGWAADFLSAASLQNTPGNRNFLTSWADNADHPNCRNNPVDLTHDEPNSTDCGTDTNADGLRTQAYTSHTWARTAFNSQLHSGKYPALLAALRSGNPYNVGNPYDVEADLNRWGSPSFGAVFVDDVRSGPPGKIKAPQALRAWADMQKSVNRHMPAALRQSERSRKAALRNLRRIRRVKL